MGYLSIRKGQQDPFPDIYGFRKVKSGITFEISVYKKNKSNDNMVKTLPLKVVYGIPWKILKSRERISKPVFEASLRIDKDKGAPPKGY